MAAFRYVFTVKRVARIFGEDEAVLEDVTADMNQEDGCLLVLDLDDNVSTTAFSVESLKELLANLKPEKPPA